MDSGFPEQVPATDPASRAAKEEVRIRETVRERRGTTSSEASGEAAATPPGPEEVPASDRLPVLGEVDRTDRPDISDRKIKMNSRFPEQVPATDRLPRAADEASGAAAAQDRKVCEKSKSPEKTKKKKMAAVAPEVVPPVEPRNWRRFDRGGAPRVPRLGLGRWKRRENGGATEAAPLPSLDAAVPGSSSFRSDTAAVASDADFHDDEFDLDDRQRSTSPQRLTREGPETDEGGGISENPVTDIETGDGRRQSTGSTIESSPPDEPTPLEAFAVVGQERREVEARSPPSDPNERRAREESLIRRHLLEEAVEGYVVPSGTTTVDDHSKTALEYLKRRPKMVCATLLALLALILGVTMIAVYVPRSSGDVSEAIKDSANAGLDGNSSSPNATQPNPDPDPDPKPEPPTVDPVAARFDAIKAALGSVSEVEALSDELSPQGRALSWIAGTDPLQLPHDTEDDVRRLVQRYILATMYFATGGGDGHWVKDYHFLEGIHECNWWNIAKPNEHNFKEEGVFCSQGVDDGVVTHLHMFSNNISGTLPDEMQYLSDLHSFLVNENPLGGTIPKWLGNMTNLVKLALRQDQLVGSIPQDLHQLTRLNEIWLHGNMLSGLIPEFLGNRTSLIILSLFDNALYGEIPEWLGRLTHLEYVYLDNNNLSGSIPNNLGDLSSLKELFLFFNFLTGQLPPSLIELSKLEVLSLFSNNITGSIPKDIDGMESLEWLHLDNNALDGEIPESLGRLTGLEQLYLDNNNLSGSIPSNLGDLSLLKILSLGFNALKGHIPESFENLLNLEMLSLEDNSLSGSFPQTLDSLVSLWLLDVHDNNISGTMNILCDNLNVSDIKADCSGTSPEVLCDCCLCYPGMRCLPSDVSSINSGPCKGDELLFAHYLQTDDYPSETSWYLGWYLGDATTDTVIASAKNYDSTCSYFEEKCLPSNGCYIYGIFDSAGDGICCDYGHGQYNITFGDAQVASGGQFGSYDIHSFGFCGAA